MGKGTNEYQLIPTTIHFPYTFSHNRVYFSLIILFGYFWSILCWVLRWLPKWNFDNRDFTQFWRNGAPFKCIVTIVTMKSQSPEQCKVEVQIVRICGSNLEPRDFSAKILAVKCSNFTLDSGSVRFQYTSVTFSNLILAPAGAQEVALSVCESVCPCVCPFFTQYPCCLLGVSQSQGPLKGLPGVSQSSLRGISAFSNAFLVIVSEHKILHLVLLV